MRMMLKLILWKDTVNKIDGVICPFCRATVTRTLTGQIGTNTVYIDDKGRRWRGHRCPDCAVEYKKQYDAKRRLKLGHKPIGQEVQCIAEGCQNTVVLKRGSHRTCESCRRSKDTED